MKKLLALLILISFTAKSQTELKFDKSFVECVDQWVAFQMSKDTSYTFGFIYIDSQAGLTYNYEGEFKISEDGHYIPSRKIENTSLKMRVKPKNGIVSIIPESRLKDLKVDIFPDWLKTYKSDTTSVEHFYRWGYLYNSWDEYEKALIYLENAKRINPKYAGLEFEFAFAYNALQEYSKAIIVLDSALITSPKDCYLLKEKAFAETQSKKIDNALTTYDLVKKHCNVEFQQEVGFNIAAYYYYKSIKDEFKHWAKKVKKHLKKDSPFYKALTDMQTDLDKKK